MSVKKAYKSWSAIYDLNENKTRDLDLLATQTILKPLTFDLAIEIGCGTGKNTVWLAEQTKKLIAIDFSAEMLMVAKNKVKNDCVSFIEADITQPWNIESNLANLVTFNLVLEHLSDLSLVFSESQRVLKQGGFLFISEIHPMKRFTGSQAKYNNVLVESYLHHTSDYLKFAEKTGFKLLKLDEWFDEERKNPPRLLTLLFLKE